MDPFLEPVVAVAAVAVAVAQAVVDAVAESVADRAAMAGTAVESAAAVEQTMLVSDSRHEQIAKTTESEVAARGWPGARVASVHTQLGTTSFGTVAVEVAVVGSVVSAFESERLQYRCSGRGLVARRLSSQPGAGSGLGEVWLVA